MITHTEIKYSNKEKLNMKLNRASTFVLPIVKLNQSVAKRVDSKCLHSQHRIHRILRQMCQMVMVGSFLKKKKSLLICAYSVNDVPSYTIYT